MIPSLRLAGLRLSYAAKFDAGILAFETGQHDEVWDDVDDAIEVKQRGINVFYKKMADDLLIQHVGKPSHCLNLLILATMDVCPKPAYPTLEQMRSRSQHLHKVGGTVKSFKTNSEVQTWCEEHCLPHTLQQWAAMDPHQVFVLASGFDEKKVTVVVLSTKAVMENVKSEVKTFAKPLCNISVFLSSVGTRRYV